MLTSVIFVVLHKVYGVILVFYELFKNLCDKKRVSPNKACLEMGLSRSLAAKWKNTSANPSAEVLSKMSEYFGVSADYLLGSDQAKTPTLNEKDERDIARDLEAFMADLDKGGALMFDGDPMTDEAKESIKAAMKLGLQAAKQKNKERFTPNKFRKE